jgi:hypothetical protein
MVTKDDLQDWMDENEEDVVMDGPYCLNKVQMDDLGKTFFAKMNAKKNTSIVPSSSNIDIWINDIPDSWNVYQGESGYDELLKTMAEIINKYNIPST